MAIDARLGHPARPGSGRFRRTLASLDGRAANDSHPEVVLADGLRGTDVPVVHQSRVIRSARRSSRSTSTSRCRTSAGVSSSTSIPSTASIEGHAADAERRREMHRLAWQIETVTEHDMADPERLADELAELYRLRRRQLADHPSTA